MLNFTGTDNSFPSECCREHVETKNWISIYLEGCRGWRPIPQAASSGRGASSDGSHSGPRARGPHRRYIKHPEVSHHRSWSLVHLIGGYYSDDNAVSIRITRWTTLISEKKYCCKRIQITNLCCSHEELPGEFIQTNSLTQTKCLRSPNKSSSSQTVADDPQLRNNDADNLIFLSETFQTSQRKGIYFSRISSEKML